MFHQAQPVIQDVISRTAEINSAIGARAHATLQSSQEISHALLEQLNALAKQGTQIPANMLDVSIINSRISRLSGKAYDEQGCWQGDERCEGYRLRKGRFDSGQVEPAWRLRRGECTLQKPQSKDC